MVNSALALFFRSSSKAMADEDNLTLRENKREKQSCIQGLVQKLKLTEEGATPPNMKYISLVFAALVGTFFWVSKNLPEIS